MESPMLVTTDRAIGWMYSCDDDTVDPGTPIWALAVDSTTVIPAVFFSNSRFGEDVLQKDFPKKQKRTWSKSVIEVQTPEKTSFLFIFQGNKNHSCLQLWTFGGCIQELGIANVGTWN